ncbi:MAG: anthranilate phosphoribosyltransferase [Proteobacteria bacterium]|nr:anthranilate phosphoribosyltransferase [Pseudomonadota bacterium]MDA1132929.1 anthranilate phosphoribosyltransferase [Pseudomonadota bacterium]
MDDARSLKPLLGIVADGNSLSVAQTTEAFDIMMSGEATPSQIGAFLMALRVRGETVDEITGAATVMRAKALPIDAPANAIDVVGTGGDQSGSYNVSTATALVVAGCGVPVAKHGNRAMSSKCGSADVLAALGVNIECDAALVQKSLEAGVCFMLAPRHHAAMRHVGPTRVELGTRTIFNLLGPLSNPAGVRRELLGVFSKQWVEPLARVLHQLGAEKAWVVHGSDGLDEMTLTGPTHVAELDNGGVRTFDVTPEDAGLPRAEAAALKGADAETNAARLRALLDGEPGAFRDIVLLNAAGALVVAGKAENLRRGAERAAESIDSGKAGAALARMVAITNEKATL